MNWGLTRFERKRIERIALDHPYFDMHAPLLTKKELRTILAQGPHKTGPQVIAEVKKELGIEYVSATQQKRSFTDALRDASFVPSFRRVIILSTLSILMALFMTFTVPGRAFAEEVYSIIVSFVNGSLRAGNSSPLPLAHNLDYLTIPDGLVSPQDLSNKLDYPIVITNDELISFHYISIDSDNMLVQSKYHDEAGYTYTLIQGLHNGDGLWEYNTGYYENITQVQSSIGVTLYGGTAEDGTNILAGFTAESTIQLSSKQLAISELLIVANKLQYTYNK